MVAHVIFFLHVLGAVMMGFYLLFPFLLRKITLLSTAGQAGCLRLAYQINFISQFTLIAQFITGGYLISKSHLSAQWLIMVFVLFVGIGACMGILSGKLRKTASKLLDHHDAPGYAAALSTLSTMIFILLIAILIVMVFPTN